MAEIKEKLFSEVAEGDPTSTNKVTVVGIGQVGMACAFSILTQVFIRSNDEQDSYMISTDREFFNCKTKAKTFSV